MSVEIELYHIGTAGSCVLGWLIIIWLYVAVVLTYHYATNKQQRKAKWVMISSLSLLYNGVIAFIILFESWLGTALQKEWNIYNKYNFILFWIFNAFRILSFYWFLLARLQFTFKSPHSKIPNIYFVILIIIVTVSVCLYIYSYAIVIIFYTFNKLQHALIQQWFICDGICRAFIMCLFANRLQKHISIQKERLQQRNIQITIEKIKYPLVKHTLLAIMLIGIALMDIIVNFFVLIFNDDPVIFLLKAVS
eukprot:98955_1